MEKKHKNKFENSSTNNQLFNTAESRVVDTSEFTKNILNTVREPLIVLDKNLKVVSASRSFYDFFKVNPEDTIGKLLYDLGNGQWNIPKLKELLETILPQKTSFENYEVIHKFSKIGKRVMLLNARQIQRGLGKELIILLAIEDITKRKIIEAGLEKAHKKLAAIKKASDETRIFALGVINTVREPLIALDQSLKIVAASQSFYKVFKVKREETIGKLLYDLGNGQWNIPKLKELLETILPQKASFDNYEVEHDFTTIGKRIMLLNARQIQRPFGKQKIILLAIEDITERRTVEKSLTEKNRLTEEYLNILLNHAHVPIIIWDASFTITRFNHEFEKISGYRCDEVEGESIVKLFPKNKIDLTLELMRNNISDEESEVIEIDILTKNNDIKTVLWNSANIFDKDGRKKVATIAQDITKRKRAEEALSISETRYRRLFESAKDGIIVLDAETGKIIDVNPFVVELFGYSSDKFIGKELWQFGFFKDIAANKETFIVLQQNEYFCFNNLILESADGRKINVEVVSNVYSVNHRNIIQCNIRDITQRINAEKRQKLLSTILLILNRHNEWTRLVKDILEKIKNFTDFEVVGIRLKKGEDYPYMETIGFPSSFVEMGNSLWTRDSDNKIIYDSEGKVKLECMCGHIISRQTNPSFPFFTNGGSFWTNSSSQFISPFSNKAYQINTRNCCTLDGYESMALIPLHSGDEVIGLLQLNDKRKNMLTLELIQSLEEIGATIGIAFKRMTIEKQIKESEEKFRIITENSADAIFITDEQGKYLYVNNQAVHLLGYSKEEMLDLTIGDLTPKNKVDESFQIFRKMVKVGSAFAEIELKKKNGNIIPTDLNLVLLPNGSVYVSCRDITERKRAEEKLIAANIELIFQSGEKEKRAGELIIAKERAEQSDKLKSEFLAQMSHEIRTPLSAIVGNACYLNESFNARMNVDEKDSFDGIDVATKRIIRTVDLILNSAELKTTGYNSILVKIDLNSGILKKLYQEYKPSAKKKRIEIIYTCNEKGTEIIGDEYSITQIFDNLIDNAIKYTKIGKVEILLERNKNDNLLVQIKDTGIGISKEYLSRIFEPFSQEEQGYSRDYEGNGLGLSLVKKYCELNNAVIEIDSEKNVGSTFRVIFNNVIAVAV